MNCPSPSGFRLPASSAAQLPLQLRRHRQLARQRRLASHHLAAELRKLDHRPEAIHIDLLQATHGHQGVDDQQHLVLLEMLQQSERAELVKPSFFTLALPEPQSIWAMRFLPQEHLACVRATPLRTIRTVRRMLSSIGGSVRGARGPTGSTPRGRGG